jgi:hypothetical protein
MGCIQTKDSSNSNIKLDPRRINQKELSVIPEESSYFTSKSDAVVALGVLSKE